jgi:hypothetical protein
MRSMNRPLTEGWVQAFELNYLHHWGGDVSVAVKVIVNYSKLVVDTQRVSV